MSEVSAGRRRFLQRGGVWAGAAAILPPLQALIGCATTPSRVGEGYGPLAAAGPELELPLGFSYAVFGVEGTAMTDGRPTPRAHDGMAAFAAPGRRVRLVRNHEVTEAGATAAAIGDVGRSYDPRCGGGTTTLELEIGNDGRPTLLRDFVSLSGTLQNCAGGPTPWGSWLSCEETTQGPGQGRREPHGYVFEVPSGANEAVVPQPLPALGRFVHEAAAVDARTGIVYLTEDQVRGGFYRCIPHQAGRLSEGGRLQMLAVAGRPGFETGRGQQPRAPLATAWVEIDEPDPASAAARPSAVFEQGAAQGGAVFTRLEGCVAAGGSIYFASTAGGEAFRGQVWQYEPAAERLTMLVESTSEAMLDGPDNLVVTPRGGLVLCEDGGGDNYLRGLSPEGEIFDLARNIASPREFAGATFSPDGRVLFVNIQGDNAPGGPGYRGMTLAIWGPWSEGPL
jgi:uncharacterized protein